MEILSHIDVAEPERIAEILNDPANFVWQAVNSETLGDWTPDLGLTGYVNPSIYRVPGVAQADRPSVLRHRFWGTVEHQSDHRGLRYVGVVIYDKAGQECPMEFRLAADEIGRVEPTRHDNRIHLIVVDKQVLFRGEMEIFQLIAPGKGEYRIEQFVLLHERPAPSSFAPRIDRLTAQRESDGSATVHLITRQISCCSVMVIDENGALVGQVNDGPCTVHAMRLEGLQPDRAYHLNVTATEKAGEKSCASTELLPIEQPRPNQATTVPIELCGTGEYWPAGLPLTFGVPLAQGLVFSGQRCELNAGGAIFAAQTRALSHWPDGSARWLLVDAIAPVASGAAELRISADTQPVSDLPMVNTESRVEIETSHLRVSFDTKTALHLEARGGGKLEKLISGMILTGALADGRELTGNAPESLCLEEAGPQRSVILVKIPITDEQGIVHLLCHLRLHIYAGQAVVRAVTRLEVVSSELPASGDESKMMLHLRRLELRLPYQSNGSARRWAHEHDQAHCVTTEGSTDVISGRMPGHFLIPGPLGTLAAGLKDFWQTWPRGFRQDPTEIVFELLPELAGDTLPGDEEAWQRIYFWLKDGIYLLKAGLALRTEWMLALLPSETTDVEAAALFDWLEHPPISRPDPGYTNATGVLVPFGIKSESPMPSYEEVMVNALEAFHDDREYYRAYGQLNFGDWYGESGWSWGNNEYDPPYCSYLEFLRGGDPRWAILGAQAARHLADIDTVNAAGNPEQIGVQAQHIPGHLGGYFPPYFRSKVSGTVGIPSHTWIEGPVLHYLLTGDEFVRESFDKTKNWLMSNHWFDNYEFSNCRESGWHIIHLCMLASAQNDPRCLNAAAVIVQRLREREDPDGGWVHVLTEAHCGCGYPRCRGEAGFMVGVLLSALTRFHLLTSDPDVKRMIVGGARWLIQHTYDAKSGYFRYTSCERRTKGGHFQKTQWILEGLADAYALTGDAEIGWYLRDGVKVIGMFPEGINHLGLGKAMAQQMRYVPAILAHLKSIGINADTSHG
jgi:hypothetical protein